jgi:branched-chain amino acid transport system permease protein
MDMSKVTSKRFLISGSIILVLLILLVFVPFYAPGYAPVLLSSILMYVILTVGWALFSGPTGYMSLATAAFFGVGIYTVAMIGDSLPFPIVVGIGGLASFCLAILVGALTLRLRGIYFIVFTFGLVMLMAYSLLFWELHVTGTRGRFVMVVDYNTIYYYLVGIFILVLLVSYFITRSRFGLALQGIGQEEEAAAHTGVNVTMVKVTTFAFSAFFMGAIGTVMATKWTYIDPFIAFNPFYSFMPVVMAIFGGMGQLYGPILGAAILTYLEEILITKFAEIYMLIFGAILMIAVLYLRDGLVGLIQKLWRRISGRVPALGGSGGAPPPQWDWQDDYIPVTRVFRFTRSTPRLPLLEGKGVTKYFGGLAAVSNVDFHVNKGEALGLIGPNGAGKTTLFNLISAALPLKSGTIYLKGKKITGLKPYRICRLGVARTFQSVKIFDYMPVIANVIMSSYFGTSTNMSSADAARQAAELVEFVGLSKFIETPAKDLTLANQKRLEVARALATRPELLLLDEMMAGLTHTEVAEAMDLVARIRKKRITIIMIEHVMKAIMSVCDRIIVLHHGEKIAEGTPEEIATSKKVIEIYLGE